MPSLCCKLTHLSTVWRGVSKICWNFRKERPVSSPLNTTSMNPSRLYRCLNSGRSSCTWINLHRLPTKKPGQSTNSTTRTLQSRVSKVTPWASTLRTRNIVSIVTTLLLLKPCQPHSVRSTWCILGQSSLCSKTNSLLISLRRRTKELWPAIPILKKLRSQSLCTQDNSRSLQSTRKSWRPVKNSNPGKVNKPWSLTSANLQDSTKSKSILSLFHPKTTLTLKKCVWRELEDSRSTSPSTSSSRLCLTKPAILLKSSQQQNQDNFQDNTQSTKT